MSNTQIDLKVTQAQQLAQRTAELLFERDQMSRNLGMKIVRVGPGSAIVAMRVRADMLNGQGSCHGGVLFSLADSAFAFACNTYNAVTIAAGATVDFILPARQGDELTAIAKELWRVRRIGLYDVAVMNQRQEQILLFRGRSHQLDSKLIND
jgi:acyl-CoA thioesterase